MEPINWLQMICSALFLETQPSDELCPSRLTISKNLPLKGKTSSKSLFVLCFFFTFAFGTNHHEN